MSSGTLPIMVPPVPAVVLQLCTPSLLPVVPAADAALKDENLPGEDAIPLLFQIEVVGVLEEDLGPAKLVVRLAQDRLADP